ncbi:MAG: hypothetical protein SVX43_14495, partial [Cyanobacteriota bacterium]|nr:hypothetical protein [Cyanobacteriota bacterium]
VQFREGTYPDSRLQQAWNENRHRRKFTFHTALEIAGDDSIVGRKAFFSDLKALAELRSREEPQTAQLERRTR